MHGFKDSILFEDIFRENGLFLIDDRVFQKLQGFLSKFLVKMRLL
jgi:hypothetical protein